jgi:dynein heavy chain, axonemal
MPPLEKAVRTIKSLKKSDLDEVKSMKKPPSKVKMTLEVICLMLGLEPRTVSDPQDLSIKYLDFWPVALNILSHPKQLLLDLENYHMKHIECDNQLMLQITNEYLSDPDFAPKAVRKASVACEGLCKWSHGKTITFFNVGSLIFLNVTHVHFFLSFFDIISYCWFLCSQGSDEKSRDGFGTGKIGQFY